MFSIPKLPDHPNETYYTIADLALMFDVKPAFIRTMMFCGWLPKATRIEKQTGEVEWGCPVILEWVLAGCPCADPDRFQETKSLPFYEINELAELLQVTRRTIYRMMTDGRIPKPIHFGPRFKRWSWVEINQWIIDGCPIVDQAAYDLANNSDN